MKRREFIASGAGVVASAGVGLGGAQASRPTRTDVKEAAGAAVRVADGKITAETKTLTAVLERGVLTSLRSKATGEEFIRGAEASKSAALHLIYPAEEAVEVSDRQFGSVAPRQVSDLCAEFVFHAWNADGVLTVSADPETGDLVVEQSAYSSRPGVRACRWNLAGLRPDLALVAPFFQGIRLSLEDPLIRNTRWPWPERWEAALAILQAKEGGFWVHAQDQQYRYKAVRVGTQGDPFSLGFESEAYGPTDGNLSAGGLSWRINVFQGDWKAPASRYRDWLWKAYGLAAEEETRRPWIHEVRFAVSWCPGDPAVLDALAKRLPPGRVLLHYPGWRSDPYDQNYPAYIASEGGRTFIRKAQEMGFRVMPHFNSVDMDPSHPVYPLIRDFQYRDIEKKDTKGWSWYDGRVIGVPESNEARGRHRDKNVMVKVHPGLSMWRSVLSENILSAVRDLNLETVFIDVTLCSWNLYNSLVEGTTSTEGMNRLIRRVASLGKGLVVGGEGLNEITTQGLSFAQAHLFKSWQTSIEGLERTGGCALNEFLFGRLCRTFGYSGLSGKNADQELRMRLTVEHGGIPTVTVRSADEILNPNSAVKRMLDLARG